MKPRNRKVEAVSHGPFSINITMDERGFFHAKHGALFSVGTLLEVRAWCHGVLRATCALKWLPVMEVNFDHEDQRVNNLTNCSNINCYIERYWIAWTGDKWIYTPWIVQRPGTLIYHGPAASEGEQPAMSDNDLMAQRIQLSRVFDEGGASEQITWPIVQDGCRDMRYLVQYTEEAWATMLGILDRIRQLRAGLNKLLASQRGWEKLALIASAQALLGPGNPPDNKR